MADLPFQLIRLDSVGSTQEAARNLVRGGSAYGTVVLALEQTAGRGREARTWESPRGLGLWFTLIHRSARPQGEWPALTVASAVGICEAIEAIGLPARSRWPNDVLLSGRKVSGVLADTEGDALLLGIGLNVLQEPDDFTPAIRENATSLRLEARKRGIETPDRERVLELLLLRLTHSLGVFEEAGPGAFLPSFWMRSIDLGGRLKVRFPSGRTVEGRAAGLGEIGQLLIETDGGTVPVASGTVVWREQG